MRDSFFTKAIVRAAAVVLCAALFALLLLQLLARYDNKYTQKAPLSQDGMAILPQSGVLFLVDGWALYPDRLLSPADFAAKQPTPRYTTWVGEWPSLAPFHLNGNPYGTATYRLLLRGQGVVSLYLPEPLCAARVFVDGTDLGGPGHPSPLGYRPLIRDTLYSFAVDGQAELIVQTANFSHYYGGLWFPPAIGSPDAVGRMVALRMGFYGLVCAASLALALFCIALWRGHRDRRDPAAFWFGLLCLALGLRVCYPFLRLWGTPLVRPLYALEDMLSLLGLYCALRLAALLFLPQSSKRLQAVVAVLALGMCGVAVAVPLFVLPAFPAFAPVYGRLVSWYKLVAAVALLAAALCGCGTGRPGARPVLAGVTANAVCLLWGVLGIGLFEPIVGAWPEEYGAVCMALVFAVLMVRRSKAMTEENLQLNLCLQQKVEEKTQHLRLLLTERGQLMTELGHDMKSPLTALSNMAQLIRINGILLDADTQQKLQGIQDKCELLASRVRSIQELSGEGGASALLEPLALNKFLADFHHSNQPVVELTGPDFLCRLTPLPCTVLADREKLSRALENLVFNAADFTPPEGQVTLSLEQDGAFAVIRVADTGCGIPAAELPRVFQRAYSTRTDEGGQGLGLAITRAIVLEHGGDISVQSTVGVGSSFCIRLPLLER